MSACLVSSNVLLTLTQHCTVLRGVGLAVCACPSASGREPRQFFDLLFLRLRDLCCEKELLSFQSLCSSKTRTEVKSHTTGEW